jgi:transketolase
MKNLIVFVDNNKQQLDGYTDDINSIGDIRTKIEDFGWFSQEVDGHNVEQIYEAIKRAQSSDKSSAIVLDTIKGKGCSFAEGVELNHHMKFKKEQMDEAIEVLLKEGDE